MAIIKMLLFDKNKSTCLKKSFIQDKTFLTQKLNAGFTLVELLVVLGIIVIFSGVVLINYGSARESFRLDSTMQEVLLTLREVQIYGTAVLETSGGSFSDVYGIYFEKNKSYYISFVDNITVDNKYTSGEEIKTTKLPSNFIIKDICTPITTCGEDELNVIFKRPSPDAIIRGENSTSDEVSAKIIIENTTTGIIKSAIIQSTGQIYIQ